MWQRWGAGCGKGRGLGVPCGKGKGLDVPCGKGGGGGGGLDGAKVGGAVWQM